jgi:F0F1-type ATP synthase assembly protein I
LFESIRKKIDEQNKENSPKNMSLDFKLFFVYHIAMMILFGMRIIGDAKTQTKFALVLGVVLVFISVLHKVKAKWRWAGPGYLGIISAIFNIVFVFAFLAFSANMFNPSIDMPEFNVGGIVKLISDSWVVILSSASVPALTPWYLSGVGIGVFNLLSSLKIAHTKKSEFEAQCIKGS